MGWGLAGGAVPLTINVPTLVELAQRSRCSMLEQRQVQHQQQVTLYCCGLAVDRAGIACRSAAGSSSCWPTLRRRRVHVFYCTLSGGVQPGTQQPWPRGGRSGLGGNFLTRACVREYPMLFEGLDLDSIEDPTLDSNLDSIEQLAGRGRILVGHYTTAPQNLPIFDSSCFAVTTCNVRLPLEV